MIPNAYIQAWSAKAPWPDARQTGKALKIAATTVPRFTAGATFKAAVAGKKAKKK